MPFQGYNAIIQISLSRYKDQHCLALCSVTEVHAKGSKHVILHINTVSFLMVLQHFNLLHPVTNLDCNGTMRSNSLVS